MKSDLLVDDPVGRYKRGEQVTRSVSNRGTDRNIHPWLNHVAQNGYDGPAYTTIGRWKRNQERDRTAPVLVPWITIDIDREQLAEAWTAVHAIIGDLNKQYVDFERTYVSFSGKKGFHIQIECSQIGNPIFANSKTAREVLTKFVNGLLEDRTVDPSTFSPLSLIRVSGSTHEDTDLKKVTWKGRDFFGLSTKEVSEAAKQGKPFEFPDPTTGSEEDSLVEQFLQACEVAEEEIEDQENLQNDSTPRGVGPVIERIAQGIKEGEHWHEKYAGRNWAAYILACWLLERPNKDTRWAWGKLNEWDRKKNEPPLQDSAGHDLKKPFESAVETVFGRNHRWTRPW